MEAMTWEEIQKQLDELGKKTSLVYDILEDAAQQLEEEGMTPGTDETDKRLREVLTEELLPLKGIIGLGK